MSKLLQWPLLLPRSIQISWSSWSCSSRIGCAIGRTQADLRRSLRAGSIRMPALLQELQRTVMQAGVVGLAERLCSIEAEWQHHSPPVVGEELAQLDLLLQSIRNDAS